jgi:transcriptional regulator with XRE-family HTH domain
MAVVKSSGPDWAGHIRRLGRLVRHARHVLTLSQVDLAKRSGVSQGGVSRLEAGKGLGTPLVTFLKIYLVLVDELRRRDPRLLDEDMRELLATADTMPAWVVDELPPAPSVAQDPDLEQLISIFRQVPPSERPGFLSVMTATAGTLSSRAAVPRPPAGPGTPSDEPARAPAPPLAELFAQLFSAAAKGRAKDAPDPDDVKQ